MSKDLHSRQYKNTKFLKQQNEEFNKITSIINTILLIVLLLINFALFFRI